MLRPPSGRRHLLFHTFSRLIDECRSMRDLKQIHAQLITSQHLSSPQATLQGTAAATTTTFLLSRLLFFAAISGSGSLPYAVSLFQAIQAPNLFMYNTMIRAHAAAAHDRRRPNAGGGSYVGSSLVLYTRMVSNGIRPGHITFPFLLKYCGGRRDACSGQAVHSHVLMLGFSADVFVQNAMIAMYADCGLSPCAARVFEEMPSPDIVSWNSILIGYLRCGELDSAVGLFRNMNERNIVSWNSIITGLAQGGRSKEALAFFHEMLLLGDDGVRPDKITAASIISVCASLGAVDQGRWVHSYMKRHVLEFDAAIGTALVDMYGKCGCVDRAKEVFDAIPEKDIFAWTAIISAFSVNGCGEEAFDIFHEMERHAMKPNHVTFGALLNACAHSGLLEKGKRCFDMMRCVYSIEPNPQHYACMVDLLGRAGHFEEALGLIRSMPMEPDAYVWGALLGGCQMHGNVELGEKVCGHLIALDPLNHAYYVALSDIYAKVGRLDDTRKVRIFMNECGIKKESPGCSMIEVNGQVYEFSVKGVPGVSMEEIAAVLNGIIQEMKVADIDQSGG